MGIGTSKGAYYDDSFHHAAAQWDKKYDTEENKSALQSTVDKKLKDLPDNNDSDMQRLPLEVSPSPNIDRSAEITADYMMRQKATNSDPRIIRNDSGEAVAYDDPVSAVKPMAHMAYFGEDDSTQTPNQRVSSAFSQLEVTPNRRVSDAFDQFIPPSSEFNEIDALAK